MKNNITGLDFETSTGEGGECVLEYVALSNKAHEEVYNLREQQDLEDFLVEILSSGETYVVYNASFDIEIIMDLLLKMGYTYITDNKARDKTMRLLAGTKIYKLDTYTRVLNRMVNSCFIDLGNIIVGSNLRDIAENYTPYHKGVYEEVKGDRVDFAEYNLLDARITRVAYENICKELGRQVITIGSASFGIMLDENYPNMKRSIQIDKFKKNYGYLTLEDDLELRKFYRGGLGWCSSRERWVGKVNSWDKKSAYPYECIGRMLPSFNDHIKYKGYRAPTKEYPFAFIKMVVTGQVKEGYCPVLPSRTPFGDSNVYIYDERVVEIIQIYGEKSEYDWFLENVDIESIEYISTILMKKAKDNPLEKFMVKYYNIKESSSGVKRDVAKRLINSLTGKLGTNPIKHNITYTLQEGVLKRDLFEETECDTYETQVVAVITSRVRCEMYRVDSLLRDKCKFRLYATDSCKHSTETEVIIGKKGIGQWNEEYEDIEFIYVGLKTYMFDPYNKEGKKSVVCAGISREYKDRLTPEDFFSGNEVASNISVRSINGRIIYEGQKRIATSPDKPRTRSELKDGKKQ